VLTGKNTDRLPEERRRGISIELGYAPLALPGGRRLSVVDVPGHERFVRTMVAGASGIDFHLLCVAADDGVMPQTREHLAVLGGLGVRDGVVAVTKSDLADPARASEEVAALVPDGTPVVPVSALRGEGIASLMAALEAVAARLPGRAGDEGPACLHVDRSFTLRGIGTVVTGTLWSGAMAAGDAVSLLPRGLSARVRSVQVHDTPVERAAAGQRVALNLSGVGWREVSRGDVVVGAGSEVQATYRIDASLPFAVEPGTRVQVHHGTRDAPARAVPLGDGIVQLRLEQPLMAARGDAVVLRQIAPPDTLGGGRVVDAAPRRRGPGTKNKEQGTKSGGGAVEAVDPLPLDDDALRIAALVRADGPSPRTDSELAEETGLGERALLERLRQLERAGLAVRVGSNLHFHPEVLGELEERVIALCRRDGAATIASVRDQLGTSRKYAQALLEHLDRKRITVRRGDEHVLRRAWR
jgi:selenocysteine-specific elongation factor